MRNYLKENRLQLWAEAKARYLDDADNDESHTLPYQVVHAQAEIAKQYARSNDDLDDAALNATEHWAGSKQGIPLAQLLVEQGIESSIDAAMKNHGAKRELGRILYNEYMWNKKMGRVNPQAKQQTLYFPPESVVAGRKPPASMSHDECELPSRPRPNAENGTRHDAEDADD